MFAGHVIESGVIKYVCVANDGWRGGREVAGVLLNDGVVVIKGECDSDAECKESGSEAPDATKCIGGSDLWWEGWCRADRDPDVWIGDVEETKAGCVKVEKKVKWESCGGRGQLGTVFAGRNYELKKVGSESCFVGVKVENASFRGNRCAETK